jgi:hypothetical protein
MVHHPLTDKGIVQFRTDWEKARKAAAEKGAARASGDGRKQESTEKAAEPVAKPGS